MSWLDLVVVLGALGVAIAGWRVGVLVTLSSLIGFLGGALLGAWLMHAVIGDSGLSQTARAVVTLVAMTVLGFVGQAALGLAGGRLREAESHGLVRVLDNFTGALVSALGWFVAMWMVLSVVGYAPSSPAWRGLQESRSFTVLDQFLAEPGSQMFAGVRSVLTSLDVPAVNFNPASVPSVGDPSMDPITSESHRVGLQSTALITSTSNECAMTVAGSGVVVGPERVATNAHVVAGTNRLQVRIADQATTLAAQVIHFDPRLDLAVLHVPGLEAPAPQWRSDSPRGTKGAVVGFPGTSEVLLRPARVRGVSEVGAATGDGTRRAEVFRGLVQSGNSGGPLLDQQGRVIGLVFANVVGDENTGFALTPQDILPVVSAVSTRTKPVQAPGCPAAFG